VTRARWGPAAHPGPATHPGPAILCGSALLLVLAWHFAWLCDDAFISFRFARHLASGGGLAFNLGEQPPVEGYSDFLWVLALAPFEAIGLEAPVVAPVLSALCGALLIACCVRFVATRLQSSSAATWSVALFLGTLAPMAIWSTGGLETMAFALAVFSLFVGLEAERPRASRIALAAVCVALVRADGPLWGIAVLACAFVVGSDLSGRRRAALQGLAVLALAVAAQSLFRWLYHGDLVPNTVRVKGGFAWLRLERGLFYSGAYLASLPVALMLPLASLAAARGRENGLAIRAALLIAFGLAYAALVGGDFLPLGRLLVPTLAPTAVLLALLVDRCEVRSRVAGWAAGLSACVLGALPLLDLHPVPLALRERLDFRWSKRSFASEIAQWRRVAELRGQLERLAAALAANTQPGQSLVADAIGVIGYRTELWIHDRFGLVDREVARLVIPPLRASPGHDRAVTARFFLERDPDYLEAFIVPAGTPLEMEVSPELLELVRDGRANVASHPLPDSLELRLVRYRGT
jgi:arabinofuranosyltransferase